MLKPLHSIIFAILCVLLTLFAPQSALGSAGASPWETAPRDFSSVQIEEPEEIQLDEVRLHQVIVIIEVRTELGVTYYAYCHNDPINCVDVLGLKSWKFWTAEAWQTEYHWYEGGTLRKSGEITVGHTLDAVNNAAIGTVQAPFFLADQAGHVVHGDFKSLGSPGMNSEITETLATYNSPYKKAGWYDSSQVFDDHRDGVVGVFGGGVASKLVPKVTPSITPKTAPAPQVTSQKGASGLPWADNKVGVAPMAPVDDLSMHLVNESSTAINLAKRDAIKHMTDEGLLPKAPIHHIATNKHITKWTPLFEPIFKKAGYGLDDAVNKVRVPGHAGPHPAAYHEAVYNRLRDATEGLKGKKYKTTFDLELNKIRTEVNTPGEWLNTLITPERK